MEGRLGISKTAQQNFLRTIKWISKLSWLELAQLCSVTDRSIRDWARGRYTIPYKTAILLSKKFSVTLPRGKILKPYWYIEKSASLGGLARYRKHGLVGSIETRRQGGKISQKKRRENPEKYRLLGCNIAKQVLLPRFSVELAELCGILLGDGGITDNQIRVTLNKNTDAEYGMFVSDLIYKIFKEKPTSAYYENALVLTISGVNLVKTAENIGLRRGNKVAQQVSIPAWIYRNKEYAKACVRGLMDTDGGVYFHNHMSNGKRYTHFGLCFSNNSVPLVTGIKKILSENGFKPSVIKQRRVYIYNLSEVKRYFEVIGTSNPKHTSRLNTHLNYLQNRISLPNWKRAGAAERA